MPEILTESFCERCGTRYTFESAAPRKTRRLGQFKTLSKGMKNWVMSDDTSLDEAMAAARSDEEREQTSQQLDAFHSTFNFCMNCRQYTCSNCWNPAEGRCLTCAPHLGREILPAPFPDHAHVEPVRIDAEAWPEIDLTAAADAGNGNGAHGDAGDPWGAAPNELGIEEIDPAARLAFLSGDATPTPPAGEPARPAEAVAEPDPDPKSAPIEPVGAEPAARATGEPAGRATGWSDTFFRDARATEPNPFEPTARPAPVEPRADVFAPEPVVADDTAVPTPADADVAATESAATVGEPLPPSVERRAEAGATRTSDLLRRFRPGQSLDAELAAFEAELERQEAAAAIAGEAPSAAVEPVAAAAAADAIPQPVADIAEPEPEPAVAEVAPEPEPQPMAAGAEPQPEPAAAVAEPELVAAELAPAPEPEPEPVAAAAPEPEPEPEPVAAGPEPEPEPEPLAASPEPTSPEPVREDRIEQPTWRIYAPDAGQPAPAQPAGPVPTSPTAPPNGNGMPQWPARPDQVDSPAMALLANRGNRGANADLWAASTREVLAQPAAGMRPGPATGVQPCTNCGLSLSATARFCRRCGTRQG